MEEEMQVVTKTSAPSACSHSHQWLSTLFAVPHPLRAERDIAFAASLSRNSPSFASSAGPGRQRRGRGRGRRLTFHEEQSDILVNRTRGLSIVLLSILCSDEANQAVPAL